MLTKEIYAMMSASAYDERRSLNDDNVGPYVEVLNDLGWNKYRNLDDDSNGATFSGTRNSGMQADVWESGNEIVVAFRGTETSRGNSSSDFRNPDGLKDKSTLSDWSTAPKFIAQIPVGDEDLSVSIADQALDAIELVQSIIDENPGVQITLTGHSLGGVLSAFVSTYFYLTQGISLSATLIDPAPFGSEYLLALSAMGFDLSNVPDFNNEVDADVLERQFYQQQADLAEDFLIYSNLISYHYIEDSVTSNPWYLTIPPSGRPSGIEFTNAGGATDVFLHSQHLHVLVASDERRDKLLMLEEKVPNLLNLLENGDITGLLGAVDINDDGLKSDYSYDVLFSILSVEPDLFDEFILVMTTVADSGGFVSNNGADWNFLLQSTSDVYDTSNEIYDVAHEVGTTVDALFYNIGLQGIREFARGSSTYYEGGVEFSADEHFWGDVAATGVVATRFDLFTPPQSEKENRSVYGSTQVKELFGYLAFDGNDLAALQYFSSENIDDGVIVSGVMAEANDGQDTVFEETQLVDQAPGGEHNFVFFGGEGSDTFNLTLAGHSYVWGNWDGEFPNGDHASFSGVDISSGDAGVTLEYQPTQSTQDFDLNGWKAYLGEASNPSKSALIFDVEQFTLTNGNDEVIVHGDVNAETPEHMPMTIKGLDGDDILRTGSGHDEIHGGLGDDIITGGSGADFIYDRGADDDIREGESLDQYVNRLLAYDGEGNDEIRAGDGSDVLVYSGGTDTYYGGNGNDTYMATERAAISTAENDKATIVLGDEGTDFGHDLILGDGQWIDKVQFQGVNLADVTINYDFEETFIGSDIFDFDPHFLDWWAFGANPQTLDHYVTVGTIEIIVNETSSLTIEHVVGYHTKGDNGGSITIAPAIIVPFAVEFEDGFMDWPNAVADASTGNLTFKDSELSDTAFAARGAMDEERSVPTETIEGDQMVSNEIYGSIEAEQIVGGNLDDSLFGGGAADILIGGVGADHMDGGSGIDTASYANATSGVQVGLSSGSFSTQTGDAAGDTFASVENLTGSDFDDVLGGDDQDNVLRGGLGNDSLSAMGESSNELYGEEGNDELRTSFGNNLLDGGTGDDTLEAWTGYDHLLGGEGDDLLINKGYVWLQVIPGQGTVSTYESGNGIYDGGAGIDTFETQSSMDAVIDLEAGQAIWAESGDSVKLISIENVNAYRGNDIIYGNDVDNVLNAGEGDDVVYGGDGNDTLLGGSGNDRLFGGTGIDTAKINGASTTATYDVVDGGIRITIDTAHPDYVWPMDSGTFVVYDDVEFIEFNDATLTYSEIAGPLQTEFEVIDDYFRVDEGGSSVVDLTDNDLELNGDPISVLSVLGTTMTVGTMIRLDSGATLTMLSDGTLEFDQGGAYAWLEPGQTATETVTYTATDSSGVPKTGSVTLVVDGVESNPDAVHLERNAIVTSPDPDKASKTNISNFNIASSVIVIDEVYVDPNNPPAGVTIEEISGDTYVLFGGDDAIVLEDISFDAWKFAAANLTLNATDQDDVLVGDAGNDSLSGLKGDDYLLGGAGDDYLYGNDGNDELLGGTGEDALRGGDGDDILNGGDGDDELQGGLGQDTYDGGDGIDMVNLYSDYDSSAGEQGAYVDLNAGIIEWKNNQGGLETLTNVENIIGTDGSDTIIGDDQDNYLDAGAGDNQLVSGGSGNDVLRSGGNGSELLGEAGDDELRGNALSQVLNGGVGDDRLEGQGGDDTYVINLGDGNDWIKEGFGDSFGDRILFGPGITSNMISLSVSDEDGDGYDNIVLSIAGTTQTVTLEDVFFANSTYNQAIEILEFADGTEIDLGELYSSMQYPGTSGNDSYVGTGLSEVMNGLEGDDTLSGGGGNDRLHGDAGNDVLNGGDGDDDHYGGDGDDLLIANIGADTFDGGAGIDTIDFTYTSNDVALDLTGGIATFENGDVETMINIENVVAGSGDNVITGSGEANIIDGGAGNDSITTGAGQDTVRIEAGDGIDTITDFDVNNDQIEINGVLINPNSVPVDITIVQAGADTSISYGSGDTLTLTGVDLVAWQGATTIPNTAPNSTDDTAAVSEDGTVLIDVLANDSDPDGDTLAITDVTGATNGTATIEAGQIRYTPNAGFTGDETLTYTVDDGNGGTDTATVTISVSATPGPIGDQVGTSGADVYFHTMGNGSYTISDESGFANVKDKLKFTDVNVGDVTFSQNTGDDLVITLNNGETITIKDHFLNSQWDMEQVEFADGTVLEVQDIRDKTVADAKASSLVTGSVLQENYVHALGDGSYTISDESGYSGVKDKLTFADVNADDVTFSQNADNDLVITLSNGEAITIKDHFLNSQWDMEQVEFADGTVLEVQDIRDKTVADAKPSGLVVGSTLQENYVHTLGDGSYVISDESGYSSINDKLQFADVNVGDVTFSQNAGNDLVITLSNGESITVQNHFLNSEWDMELFEFADGTVLDAQAIVMLVATGNVTPTATDDTVSLVENGTALIDVLANDSDPDGDALTIVNVTGASSGTATIENGQIRYTPNAGFSGSETLTYTIDDGNGGTATATVSITVTAANAAPTPTDDTATVNENDTVLVDVLANDSDPNGDTLTISAVSGASNGTAIIENGQIRYTPNAGFSGAETLTYTVDDGKGGTDTATVTITVSPAQTPGVDQVGTTGADIYTHALGDGSYTITDVSSGSALDKLIFTDVNAGDVTFSQNSSDDLIITLSNGETVTIKDHFYSSKYDLELIEFADGTVLDAQAIRDKSVADQKASGTVTGSYYTENYSHALGDGSYTISDVSSGSALDKLKFTDVNAGDVTFSQNSGDDLIITLSNGETVTIRDHFYSSKYDLELIEFADGTVLDAQAIRDKSVADQKASGTVKGSYYTENYSHALGDGSYTISDVSSGSALDKLKFTDVNAGDVTFSQNSGDDLIITLSNGEAVTIRDHFYSSKYDLELIEFADGTVLDAQAIRDKTLTGGTGDDTIIGFSSDDTLNGGAGNDTLTGGSGSDEFVFNSNFGNDIITDFSDGADMIRVGIPGVGFDDLVITQSGTDAEIDIAGHGKITLEDFDSTLLNTDDFLI